MAIAEISLPPIFNAVLKMFFTFHYRFRMKICKDKPPNTFMILEGLYCTFQFHNVMDFL